MSPSFPPANWPQELIVSTFSYLTLVELSNLRLASKELADLVAQGDFRQYYRTKHVDATPESLGEFVHMTKPGLLGAQVKHIVLTGVAISTEHLEQIVKERARWVTEGNGPIFSSTQHKLDDAEVAEAKKELDGLRRRKKELKGFHESGVADALMTEAFVNVAAYSRNGKLSSLVLDVEVFRENLVQRRRPIESRAKQAVWQTASSTFRVAMAGLAESGLPLNTLDAFTRPWHCSLGWSALSHCVDGSQSSQLSRSLHGLQSLALSLSHDLKPADASEVERRHRPAEEQTALADFVALCPELTHLHLHWFLPGSADRKGITADQLLRNVAGSPSLQRLENLTLRGLRVQGLTLLDLIKGAPLNDLCLEEVITTDPDPVPEDIDDESDPEADVRPTPRPDFKPIHSSGWNAIFAHCSSPEADMSSILFDDLWGERLLHFRNGGGPQKMPWTPHTKDSPTLERKGEDVRREIEYTYARGRPLCSPQAYMWRQMRQREYGPA